MLSCVWWRECLEKGIKKTKLKDMKMKGKNTFTKAEIAQLKQLIVKRCNAPSSEQKAIRDDMRAIGFYGRDDFGIVGMTVEKFEELIKNKDIKVV